MIELLKKIWAGLTNFFLPEDYFSWQTIVYLGLFSFVMSWIARLSDATAFTEGFIATAGWLFFALGVGWFLEENKIRPFGIPIAPWVAGAILCIYFSNLLPEDAWPIALVSWPLVSFAIAAIPEFLNWELKPKVPHPVIRQRLILFFLVALLFSSWFQFYFRLQSWFNDYPSLVADDFRNSGFVYRLATQPEEQAAGISLLTAAEAEVQEVLDSTPWPYVERWLLNLNEQLVRLQSETVETVEDSLAKEGGMWQLRARPRGLNDGYALDLIAVWSGPASDPDGYYFEKTCILHPRSQSRQRTSPEDQTSTSPTQSPTQIAEVDCELATLKRLGKPGSTTE